MVRKTYVPGFWSVKGLRFTVFTDMIAVLRGQLTVLEERRL